MHLPIEIETGSNPEFAVIWMHGLGADGSDFVPVVPELGLGDTPGGYPNSVFFAVPPAPTFRSAKRDGYPGP
jgi:phospholipase/carboxylesterase